MLSIEILGFIAACCTTFSFIPQVIKLYRTRATEGISLGMYFIFSTGVFLWCVYGVMISSPSLILANALTFVFALSVLVMKLIWK